MGYSEEPAGHELRQAISESSLLLREGDYAESGRYKSNRSLKGNSLINVPSLLMLINFLIFLIRRTIRI